MNADEHPLRRRDDLPLQPVALNSMTGMSKKFADHAIALLFGVFLAFVTGFPATLWAGSRWTSRIEGELKLLNTTIAAVQSNLESHVADNDARVSVIAEGVNQIDKTMMRVVANQENLQARVERLERNDDSEHRIN